VTAKLLFIALKNAKIVINMLIESVVLFFFDNI
jgi:hypothetical protein